MTDAARLAGARRQPFNFRIKSPAGGPGPRRLQADVHRSRVPPPAPAAEPWGPGEARTPSRRGNENGRFRAAGEGQAFSCRSSGQLTSGRRRCCRGHGRTSTCGRVGKRWGERKDTASSRVESAYHRKERGKIGHVPSRVRKADESPEMGMCIASDAIHRQISKM